MDRPSRDRGLFCVGTMTTFSPGNNTGSLSSFAWQGPHPWADVSQAWLSRLSDQQTVSKGKITEAVSACHSAWVHTVKSRTAADPGCLAPIPVETARSSEPLRVSSISIKEASRVRNQSAS